MVNIVQHHRCSEAYRLIPRLSYDAHCVIALVRAAEAAKSPAIIQLFPITLAYGKGPFLQFCLNAYGYLYAKLRGSANRLFVIPGRAHQASVPISVHLDHATDPEHLELALGLAEQGIAFDSIMVDASHADVSFVVGPVNFWKAQLILYFIINTDR